MSLRLRPLVEGDEAVLRQAQREFAGGPFEFLPGFDAHERFAARVALLEVQREGRRLPDGFVPSTFLVAEFDGVIVGRAYLRHSLTDRSRRDGGHVGYGVRPMFRRQGHATEILRQSLRLLAAMDIEKALVTVAVDNVASQRTVEKFPHRLDDPSVSPRGVRMRRYWVSTSDRPETS